MLLSAVLITTFYVQVSADMAEVEMPLIERRSSNIMTYSQAAGSDQRNFVPWPSTVESCMF